MIEDVWLRFKVVDNTMIELDPNWNPNEKLSRWENDFNLPPGEYKVVRVNKGERPGTAPSSLD